MKNSGPQPGGASVAKTLKVNNMWTEEKERGRADFKVKDDNHSNTWGDSGHCIYWLQREVGDEMRSDEPVDSSEQEELCQL